MKLKLTKESKERVTNLTGRIVLMLQQRDFSAAETSALILCLQGLLDHQAKKHGIEPVNGTSEGTATKGDE